MPTKPTPPATDPPHARELPMADPTPPPEVTEFLAAAGALHQFKQAHAALYQELEALVERYNATLEAAEKACRASNASAGPFERYQVSVKYDAEALAARLPPEVFAALGGRVEEQKVYRLDRTRLDEALADPHLPADVSAAVQVARKETPSYHKPPKVVLP